MNEIVMIRTNHLVDPHLHIWGWEIPVYLFLGGLTAGIMVVTSILILKYPKESLSRWARWMPFAGPILLSIGMLALFLDLEHKLYVWRFYLAFKITSPISWGAWILLLIYPVALLLGLINLTPEERSATKIGFITKILNNIYEVALEYRRAIIWANIILGVALGTYTGIFLGSLGARALWSSPILGPLFLVSGLSTAMAMMMLFQLKDEEYHDLLEWDKAAIVVELILIAIYILGLITSGSATKINAAQLFLGSGFGVAFLILVVLVGLFIPVVLEFAESRLKKFAAVTAPVLILIGGFAMRWILVYAGQVV